MYVLSQHNMHSWSSPFIVCRYGFMATGKLVTPYTVCQSAPAGAMNHYADDVEVICTRFINIQIHMHIIYIYIYIYIYKYIYIYIHIYIYFYRYTLYYIIILYYIILYSKEYSHKFASEYCQLLKFYLQLIQDTSILKIIRHSIIFFRLSFQFCCAQLLCFTFALGFTIENSLNRKIRKYN